MAKEKSLQHIEILNAISTVMEYILNSEMEGKYDPNDSYSGSYNVLKDLMDKIMNEVDHIAGYNITIIPLTNNKETA
jgi:hypothetical protein